jgi:hypothetical protein
MGRFLVGYAGYTEIPAFGHYAGHPLSIPLGKVLDRG